MKMISRIFNTVLYAFVLSVVLTEVGMNPMESLFASIGAVELGSLLLPMSGLIGANVYADTVLQGARAFIKDKNNKKFELRPTLTRIVDMYMKDREYTIPSLSKIREAATQTTTATYLKAKDFTVTTDGKSCTPSGEQSGSAAVALTWVSKTVNVYTSFKQHAGNEVSMARALANDLYNAEKSLYFGATGLDAALLAHLEANKSDENNGGSGTFDPTEDIMAINAAQEDDFYNLVTADMQTNNYNPEFLEAHDTMWTAKQRRYANQGSSNDTNLAFQFSGFEFMPSNLIQVGTLGSNDYSSIHYVVPSEGVAILDWNDPLNVAGKVSGVKTWGTYQSLLMPSLTLDLMKNETCADTSADGGGKQDFTEVWELTLNYALAVQPTPTGSPIFKYGVLKNDFIS